MYFNYLIKACSISTVYCKFTCLQCIIIQPLLQAAIRGDVSTEAGVKLQHLIILGLSTIY